MNVFYLDSSVWVKRYQREPGTDFMKAVWNSGWSRASCFLGLIEVTSAIVRRHAHQQVANEATAAVLTTLGTDYKGFIEVHLGQIVHDLAMALTTRHRLRGADAIHLAAAVAYARRSTDRTVVVTSDLELIAAAQAEGLATLDPSTNPPLPT